MNPLVVAESLRGALLREWFVDGRIVSEVSDPDAWADLHAVARRLADDPGSDATEIQLESLTFRLVQGSSGRTTQTT